MYVFMYVCTYANNKINVYPKTKPSSTLDHGIAHLDPICLYAEKRPVPTAVQFIQQVPAKRAHSHIPAPSSEAWFRKNQHPSNKVVEPGPNPESDPDPPLDLLLPDETGCVEDDDPEVAVKDDELEACEK